MQDALASEGSAPPGWVDKVLRPQLKAMTREVFRAAETRLVRRRGVFELFGLDFMVDAGLRPWLLEANCNPALWVHSAVQRAVLPPLVRDSLAVVLELHAHTRAADAGVPASALASLANSPFTVLFDGAEATPEAQCPPLL